ncbi:aspartic peptidase domain-containing protein [Xylariomycetidae sp. FL0641]|nr:aspartic peptidase domain-containing protein [Xylariomycetidae sp. FL0641]
MRTTALATGSLVASVASAQVVQWDIAKRASGAPKFHKRDDGTVTEIISNEKNRGGYFATCSVGTPGQNMTLQLDTGSSDIWVPDSESNQCADSKLSDPFDTSSQGCTLGSFTPDESSSFEVVGKNAFDISYVDGSHSTGDYFTDTFTIGGVSVENTTMGLGLDTNIAYGLVGVGYALNEAIVATTGEVDQSYDNLPVQMLKQGLINTNAYSLWLNDLDASKGNILFGGIDTDKYEGDLTRIKVYQDSNSKAFTSFTVALTSLIASSSSGSDTLTSDSFPIPVVLDSGTTFSYVPDDLAEQIWQEVGAGYNADVGTALLPCDLENSDGYFSFQFGGEGGPMINVTMDELVMPLTTGEPIPFTTGEYKGRDACQFGIQNITNTYLLGDTFLRSAYVVYDLENNEIGIARTDFNATTSNVVAFPSKGAEIPSSTPAPNQDSISKSGSSGSPGFNAQGGFTGGKGGDGGSGAASLPPALDWSKMAVVGATVCFTMLGSGMFLHL